MFRIPLFTIRIVDPVDRKIRVIYDALAQNEAVCLWFDLRKQGYQVYMARQ